MIHWISVSLLVLCAGCATPARILNSDGQRMIDLMRNAAEPAGTDMIGRHAVRYAIQNTNKPGQRRQTQSLNRGPYRIALLPNPTIRLYIYPHIATRHRAPVPGYHTAIKLYARDEYALPGEYQRVENDANVQ